MCRLRQRAVVSYLGSVSLLLCGCGGGANSTPSPAPTKPAPTPSSVQLVVQATGAGQGMIESSPAGINCGHTCSANFAYGTKVTLDAAAMANSFFAGWSGACNGMHACEVTLTKNVSVTGAFATDPRVRLSVSLAGAGQGNVTSMPAGINCGPTCSTDFNAGSEVTLSENAAQNSSFAGWGGACSGNNPTCRVTLNANQKASATFNTAGNGGITVLNHILFLSQENRSFDHYLGALRAYWAANNIPDQSLDGLPQFNPTSGIPPLYGPPPTNPGCDPAYPPPARCHEDGNSPQLQSFQLITQCAENPGDGWNESHVDYNLFDPTSGTALLNGLVDSAADTGRHARFYDTAGLRAMGYNNYDDLNYYYFMATNFATSDRWFSPVMTRTPPNRMYMHAATSQGYVHPLTYSDPPLTAMTIWQELEAAGMTWKIYVNPQGSPCTGPPYQPSCLLTLSTLQDFAWGLTIPKDYPNNIAPISEYFTDLQNNTLPQVAFFEPASDAGLDEHPTNRDNAPSNIERGANYVSSLINALMQSTSWKDSAFILTWDEYGGFYDHVPPQPTVSPDGIKPVDLQPGDICYPPEDGPTCDFVYTGFRLPLLVVSPYTKKNYVSHTIADTTAYLKLIETRFGLAPLTKRDAAQMDMTEFFDFNDPPWMSPPKPPVQVTSGACYVNKLP